MSHEIAGVTTCRLCAARFTGPTAEIVGQPHGRLMGYLKRLAQHIVEKHPQENEALQLKSLEYLGLLRMMHYATTDPELAHQVDFLRWLTHQSTLNARLPDDKLKLKSAEVARELVGMIHAAVQSPEVVNQDWMIEVEKHLVTKFTDRLIVLITGLRDILEERIEEPAVRF